MAVPHASSVLVAMNWHMGSKAGDCKFLVLCLDKVHNSHYSTGYCSTEDAAEIEVAKAEACVRKAYNHGRKPDMDLLKCGSDDSTS